MNFELGKEYIVKVSKEGIIPIEEFKSDRFYDKDHDDLDFLTDEEKIIVTNDVLDKIKADILNHKKRMTLYDIFQIIDKYKTESADI